MWRPSTAEQWAQLRILKADVASALRDGERKAAEYTWPKNLWHRVYVLPGDGGRFKSFKRGNNKSLLIFPPDNHSGCCVNNDLDVRLEASGSGGDAGLPGWYQWR